MRHKQKYSTYYAFTLAWEERVDDTRPFSTDIILYFFPKKTNKSWRCFRTEYYLGDKECKRLINYNNSFSFIQLPYLFIREFYNHAGSEVLF